MRKEKQLAARIAVIAGAVALVTASAFADSRPSNETRWRDGDRGTHRRDGDRDGDEYRRRDDSRNNDRRDRDDRNDRYEQRERGERFQTRGRVSRVDRYGNGYRVYVGGARYPFYVPDRHYRRDRFRVGVTINIGGIYNPGGYYDYYEDDYGYHSRGDLRGVVQDIDRRSGTFLLRTEGSGRHVTVAMRDYERVRRGDYVELFGDWSRRGVFVADDVDILDRSRGRRW